MRVMRVINRLGGMRYETERLTVPVTQSAGRLGRGEETHTREGRERRGEGYRPGGKGASPSSTISTCMHTHTHTHTHT